MDDSVQEEAIGSGEDQGERGVCALPKGTPVN